MSRTSLYLQEARGGHGVKSSFRDNKGWCVRWWALQRLAVIIDVLEIVENAMMDDLMERL